MPRKLNTILGLWYLTLIGCGTFSDAVCGPIDNNVYYRGVRLDLEAVQEGGAKSLMVADLPLSAVADTLLIPYCACIVQDEVNRRAQKRGGDLNQPANVDSEAEMALGCQKPD
jgi:uncharacterized protein YceK